MRLEPDPQLVARFGSDLDRLIPPDARVGIAVSGGADSLALLLLAAGARPGKVEAATVDHALRPGSAAEAELVAGLCSSLEIPHSTLAVEWAQRPQTAVQERARAERYRLLARWLEERKLDALATAHHLDDQAETLLMRLARGSGVRGLAAIRPASLIPGNGHKLIRPMLTWRRAELERVCAAADAAPVHDPSNGDERFERVRVRNLLSQLDLDVTALTRSAENLAEADAALEWAVEAHWQQTVLNEDQVFRYQPGSAPPEVRRRVLTKVIASLATEGDSELRGGELDRLLAALSAGGTATLRGVRCAGGETWLFETATPRRG